MRHLLGSTAAWAAEQATAAAPALGSQVIGITLMVLLAAAIIRGCVYFIMAMERAWFNRAREAASAFGCPHPPFRNKTFTEDYEVHQWDYQGVPMILQAGSQAQDAPPGSDAAAVVIMSAAAVATLPKPLPFRFSIKYPRMTEGPRFATGDAEFDAELAVQGSDEAAARRLLDSPQLRKTLREFFQSDRSLPTVMASIDEKEVRIRIFDRSMIKDLFQQAAQLALLLSKRAGEPGSPTS